MFIREFPPIVTQPFMIACPLVVGIVPDTRLMKQAYKATWGFSSSGHLSWGKRFVPIMCHWDASARPSIVACLLHPIILPASLIMGGFATAEAHTDTGQPTLQATPTTPSPLDTTPTLAPAQPSRPAEDPTRDGYLFDGWFTKDAKGDSKVAYDFTQPVTENLTLTAHWTKGTSVWSLSPNSGRAAGCDEIALTPPAKRNIRLSHISNGEWYTLAMGSDGNVYSWGQNQYGQLGDGSMQNRSKPQSVKGPDGQPFKASQVSAAFTDSAAIDLNGRIYVWGSETNDKSTYSTPKLTPALAKDPSGSDTGLKAVQVRARYSSLMALDADGNVYTRGHNSFDQLGSNEGTSNLLVPSQVSPPAGQDSAVKRFAVARISAGSAHSLAISQDGKSYSWGSNVSGQRGIGSGNIAQRTITPTPVALYPTQLITGIRFDQIAANSLQQNPDESFTLATPADNPELSDVIVDRSLGVASQTPTHLSYTFKGILPLAGSTGVLLLLASGLLAVADALAAGRHRHESTSLE